MGDEWNSPNALNIWALGVAMVIGCQCSDWGYGLAAGFGSFAIASFLMAIAYFCMVLCLSEISSALPFVGGAYSLTRCTIGFYPGYVVGCLNVVKYVFLSTIAVIHFSEILCNIFSLSQSYQPIFWSIFYIASNTAHFISMKGFWRFVDVLAILSLLIVVIFFFGTLKWVNFNQNAKINNDQGEWFHGGIENFLSSFKFGAWFFVGVEVLGLTHNESDNPKKEIPQGSMLCIVSVIITFLITFFSASSIPPNPTNLQNLDMSLSNGLSLLMNSTPTNSNVILLPVFFATGMCFLFPSGIVFESMSEAHLLPVFLKQIGPSGSPYNAVILSSFLGIILCIISRLITDVSRNYYNIAMLAAFLSYIAHLYGYILVKTRYSEVRREFMNPLGIFGAILPMILFLVGIVSVIGFSDDRQAALLVVLVIWGFASLYYFGYAKARQTFSGDEQKVIFKTNLNDDGGAGETVRQRRRQAILTRKPTGFERGIKALSQWSSMSTVAPAYNVMDLVKSGSQSEKEGDFHDCMSEA